MTSGVDFVALAAAEHEAWALEIHAATMGIEDAAHRPTIERICREVMAVPTAVAHPVWHACVRDLINLSKPYGYLSKRAYGKALPVAKIHEDVGRALAIYRDEHLYTYDWLLDMLRKPAPMAHPSWHQLVVDLCEHKYKCVRDWGVAEDEMSRLLAHPEAGDSPRIVEVARAAFPKATYFTAGPAPAPAKETPTKKPAKQPAKKPTKKPVKKPTKKPAKKPATPTKKR